MLSIMSQTFRKSVTGKLWNSQFAEGDYSRLFAEMKYLF